MDTSIDNELFAHKSDESTQRLALLLDRGLYYSNIDDYSGVVHVITTPMKDPKTKYSALDIRRATPACQPQVTINEPITKDFLQIIKKSFLKYCGTTTRKDILITEDIFEPCWSSLKGKTPTYFPTHIREDNIPVPDEILDNYKNICLGEDIFFVKGILFITTISRCLHFTIVKVILNVETKTLLRSLNGNFAQYYKCRFRV